MLFQEEFPEWLNWARRKTSQEIWIQEIIFGNSLYFHWKNFWVNILFPGPNNENKIITKVMQEHWNCKMVSKMYVICWDKSPDGWSLNLITSAAIGIYDKYFTKNVKASFSLYPYNLHNHEKHFSQKNKMRKLHWKFWKRKFSLLSVYWIGIVWKWA